jgi:hypothetical protein
MSKPKKSEKCQSTPVPRIFPSPIQYRSYSGSKIGGVHQRTLIREWNNIGYELSGQGRHSEALEAFNKVLATENSDVSAVAGKAFISLQLKNLKLH